MLEYFHKILPAIIILTFTGVIPHFAIILAYKNYNNRKIKSIVLFSIGYIYFLLSTSIIACGLTGITLFLLSSVIFMRQSFITISESIVVVLMFITLAIYMFYVFKYAIRPSKTYDRYMEKIQNKTSEKFVNEILSIKANQVGERNGHMGVGLYFALYKTLLIHLPVYMFFIVGEILQGI